MPKVRGPLFSVDVRGAFGKKMIFRTGGVVTNYFKPKNPNTPAQQAQRQFFKDHLLSSLTQVQADLLYAAISHLHDNRYVQVGALDPFPQYLTQSEGDGRYPLAGALDPFPQYLTQSEGGALYSPLMHSHTISYVLPFVNWVNPIPLIANGQIFAASLGATVGFLKLTMSVRVLAPNNVSNYWNINLKDIRNATGTIATMKTNAIAEATWSSVNTSTFAVSSKGLIDLGLYITAEKTGSPGSFYGYGPVLLVY